MRGGGPPLSVGSVGRAEPLRYVLCKGEGLPRERSSAGDGVAIIPRCVVMGDPPVFVLSRHIAPHEAKRPRHRRTFR